MPNQVVVCAHRGASGTHPENTIPAFVEAAALGCEMVEFDVRATADGHLVILHDETVDRTTDGTGKIWQLSFAETRRLNADAGHDAHAGVQIPTLHETLDCLPGGMQLNMHVYPGPSDGDAIVDQVCQTIKVRNLYATAFIAGSDEVIQLVINTDAKVRRCLLGSQNRVEIYAQLAKQMGCCNVQPLHRIVSKEFCDKAHRLGLFIHPFYAD
ncbi:MAG: glycerophosphodiester phosphodiesterase family protein, partial [Candidatus Latescibacterota bacterium]|nr:glycerophosphodiester phosphodiesterase family protein [Candidatus Latescibacterota bacterium]